MTPSARLNLVASVSMFLTVDSPMWASEPVALRPDWTPGVALYVEFTWDNEDTERGSDHPSGEQHRRTRQTYGFLHQVEKVTSAGAATIRLTVERAAVSIKGDDIELFYDTDAPEEVKGIAAYGRKLQSLLGQSLSMTVGRDGRVDTIEGTEQAVRRALPDDSDPYRDDVAVMFSGLTLPAQTNLWRQYYGYFAFNSVKVGDTWTRRVSRDAALDVRYTLERIEGPLHSRRAVVAHTAHLDRSSDWQDRGGVLLQSGPYDASGRTVIDVDAGCIVSSEETVTQEVRAKRQDEKGREVWWIATTNSARHTLIVLTEAERKVAKGNRETGTEP